MRRLGEHAGDRDLVGDGGIRAIDDAGRGLTALDQQHAGADIRRRGNVRGDLVPQPQPRQRLLGIETDGHVRRVANGQPPVRAEQAEQIEAGLDVDFGGVGGGNDQHQFVA